MDEREFKQRPKTFAIEVLRFIDLIPKEIKGGVVARQLARCGSSMGANYRAACRAKSRPDMIAKLAIVEEEADESKFWLEVAWELYPLLTESAKPLHQEADEILRMVIASQQTLKSKKLSSDR